MWGLKWYTDKAQSNTWKTRHMHIINTKVIFLPEQNISSTFQTQWRFVHHYGDVIMNAMASQINRVFRGRSKKTSKLRLAALCGGNSPVIGEFPSQRASKSILDPSFCPNIEFTSPFPALIEFGSAGPREPTWQFHWRSATQARWQRMHAAGLSWIANVRPRRKHNISISNQVT